MYIITSAVKSLQLHNWFKKYIIMSQETMIDWKFHEHFGACNNLYFILATIQPNSSVLHVCQLVQNTEETPEQPHTTNM